MGRERLEPEFGRYAVLLADAILDLGLDAVPVACRGTGNPALFERLAEALAVDGSAKVLDVGCGMGGPGAWLRRNRSCEVIGVDVMEGGVRSLRRLFPDSPAVVATTRRLPFRDGSFDGAWALGVVETIDDKASALGEVRRVLSPEGRFAAYSFVATTELIDDSPSADRFETADSLVRTLEGAGFAITDARRAHLPVAPDSWREARRRVREHIHARSGQDELLEIVEAERAKIGHLTASGQIEPWIFVTEGG